MTLDELLNNISKKEEAKASAPDTKVETSGAETNGKAEATEATETTEGTEATETTEAQTVSEDGMPMSEEFMSFCETRKE